MSTNTGADPAAAGVKGEQDLTNALVLRGLNRISSPQTKAGSAFAYSNIGYVLLAETLTALSGLTLPELARTLLFDPLGMKASDLAHEPDCCPLTTVSTPKTLGDGGWWASAADLLIWLDALNCDQLGSNLTAMVQAPGYLSNDRNLWMALGLVT